MKRSGQNSAARGPQPPGQMVKPARPIVGTKVRKLESSDIVGSLLADTAS